jgi:polyamine oxidase
MLELDQPDMNQRGYFQRAGWVAKTPEEFTAEVFDVDFDFGFPPSETSTKYPGEYSYSDFADEDYFTISPYSAIPQGIADEMFSENDSMQRLFLDSVVSEVKQGGQGEGERVTVTTTDGRTFEAEQVIVAVSLGVLQNYHLKFSPDLPDWKWDAIQGFQFGHYLHFYLRFPSVFWDDTLYILHASTRRGHYTVWNNLNKVMPGCNILQANVIQYESQRLQSLPDDLVKADAMAVLRDMYGEAIPDAIEIVVPRFGTDPLFMGSFSNWPPGYTSDSHKSLQASIGRVHFAGEYASFRYYGYAHGALLSGEQVAGNVLTCLTDSKKCERDYVPPHEARGCTYNAAANHDPTAQGDDGSCRFQACPSASAVGDTLPAWSLIFFMAAARHMIE